MVVWSDATLDRLRHVGDPEADAVVAAYFRDHDREPAAMFRGLVGRPDDEPHPAVTAFYETPVDLPPWADPDLLHVGAEFFCEYGLEIGIGLFCSALPIGYAAAPTARVLDLTGQLETSAHRRVFETAQMVLDVTRPGALAPGKPGQVTVRHVRLMHAAVRHLVTTDARISRVDAAQAGDDPHWRADYGVPISQEHLLGALLAFGLEMLRVLDCFGVQYTDGEAEAYLHLWSVVGFLIGVDPALLPLDRVSAEALDPLVRRRDLAPTQSGIRLTAALLDLLQKCGPQRFLNWLPAVGMRHLLGEEIADMLAVPKTSRIGRLFIRLRPVTRFARIAKAHDAVSRLIARRVSRAVMVGFVVSERGTHRPAFAIPERLQEQWKLSTAKGRE